MSSSRYKAPKEKRQKEEPETRPRAQTPSERRREWFINFGVAILVLAFLMTSGIVYVNLNQEQPGVVPEVAGTPMSPMEAQLSQIDAEIQRWNEELATNPNDVTALANLGYYYKQKAQVVSMPIPAQGETPAPAAEDGRRDEFLAKARDYLQKALERDPNYAFAHQQLAETLIVAEQYEEARRQAEAALEAAQRPIGEDEDPAVAETARLNEKVQAHMLLGRLEAQQENFQAAIDQLSQAIELKPGETQAYIARALVYRRLEQEDQAKQDLQKALDIAQKMMDRESMILASALLEQMEPETPESTPAATPTPQATPAATPTPAETPAPEITATPEATPTP